MYRQIVPEWALVEDMRRHFEINQDLPPSVLTVIAERLDSVTSSGTESALGILAKELLAILRAALRTAPEEAASAALGSAQATTALRSAYTLGQLSFAQLVAAQAAARRAGDDFLALLSSTRFRKYAEALFGGDLRNVDLAQILGVSEEHVSRNLKILREEGIADFRREGRDVWNFLTPAAYSAMEAIDSEPTQPTQPAERPRQEVSEASVRSDFTLKDSVAVRRAMDNLPAHFHKMETLSNARAPQLEVAL